MRRKGIVSIAIVLVLIGALTFGHWTWQENNKRVYEEATKELEARSSWEPTTFDSESNMEVVQDVINRYNEPLMNIIHAFSKHLNELLEDANEEYASQVIEDDVSYDDFVRTYADKANEVEQELDKKFYEQYEALKEELKENDEDENLVSNYELEYVAVKEETRHAYIQRLTTLAEGHSFWYKKT